MTFELKPLSREAVPSALEKAQRYRLLNEPGAAESICLDVLQVDPESQDALIMLLLALTDQFDRWDQGTFERAREVLPKLTGEYERAYYAGIVCERRAKAQVRRGGPNSGHKAYDQFREAMEHYERAETFRPSGNDDSILRWNACARAIMRNPELQPWPREEYEPSIEE
jgi:hypothetical protein